MKKIGALEAGGTKMVLAVGTEDGQILDRISMPTETPEITMPKMIDYFRNQRVEAVGVGCFGPIDVNKKSPTYGYIKMTPKLAWRNYDILGGFGRALQVPMYFDTDVNASALGEFTYGSGKDVNNLIYMTIGTGIGIGVIAEGKPLHGAMHPEGGHILIPMRKGETFGGVCPTHGNCFEGMCSGPSMEARWGRNSRFLADDPEALEIESHYIAEAIETFICTLSPERIILGGGVMKMEKLFPLVRKKVIEMLNGYLSFDQLNHMEDYIVAPSLDDNQGILGCIAMTLKED